MTPSRPFKPEDTYESIYSETEVDEEINNLLSSSSYPSSSGPFKPFTKRSSPNVLIIKFKELLSLPYELFFAITGLMGIANYVRHIVQIIPSKPATISLREIGGAKPEVRVDRWIKDNVESLKGVFKPAWWAPNGHLQTFFTVLGDFTKVDKVHYVRTYLRLPDGGTIGIDTTPVNHQPLSADTPTIVVCHGLTGGSHESYVRNVLSWVARPKDQGGMGARAAVVNFRGCAGVPVTSPQMYSAGTTMDLAIALHHLRHKYPSSPLFSIGFSLGASVLSRYLGEAGESSLLSAGIILGCPWDLTLMSHKLDHDWFHSRVYSSALGQNVLKLFFKAYDANPPIFDADDSPVKEFMDELKVQKNNMGSHTRLRKVDDLMVCKIGGPRNIGVWPFKDAEEYYQWASPKRLISRVRVPLLAINAFDDPVVDCTALPLEELKSSTHVVTAITGSGGHLGWFDGPFPLWSPTKSKHRWVLKPVSEFLTATARDLDVVGGNIDVVQEEGWEWVEDDQGHAIPGLHRRGWKVLKEGEEILGEGDEGETGVIQGL
ncbi:anon-23da protein [Kwoniella mangroviensis CBS 8886]|uniref:uncharacterized protein n=1 Tax=Kwoniella mangroviensis CBS 8507 TaxID=1296122 RepID=UPI00080D84A5|nr:anon-23da protein [Kwoniella mangroviensis CBS 8507]OCF66255.1 anon-23da protein [Kwoniella mangroviensis CBS 8507]OCF73392.1 anon-23da protein [Kwoniella mangroviensis CBS 8886]